MGFGAAAGCHEAALAGVVRAGGAVVSAALPQRCQCGSKGALLSPPAAQAEQLREPFEGAIECDETTFGGARHGPRGWGALGKVIVFGLIKRNGRVKAIPIPRHDRLSVMREIEAHTREVCAVLHR